MEQAKADLIDKIGEERGSRITDYNRNILLFPSLVINDIMAVTARTYYPTSPGFMEVQGYALARKGEGPEARLARNDSFLEFLGNGGFATPNENDAQELCKEGCMSN